MQNIKNKNNEQKDAGGKQEKGEVHGGWVEVAEINSAVDR